LLLKFGAQVDDEDDDARGLRQVWSDVKRKLHRKSQAWTPLCLAAEERYEEVLFNLHLALIFTIRILGVRDDSIRCLCLTDALHRRAI